MIIEASVKNIRISAEKVKLVVDQIKKMPPQKAIQILNFVNKSSSPVLKKVIASALANAKNNHGISEGDLIFKEILVGNGPMFKRFRPVSRGRAHHILKRTSNIKIVLESKAGETKVSKAPSTKEVSKVDGKGKIKTFSSHPERSEGTIKQNKKEKGAVSGAKS
ncbi:MAG: 50S ribosomal protein L22 [Candidatus Curtissbacteria bacterium]|nr:50S ribosomal protein L22 [Candidatus Curtissbacteria bacterium]